MHTYTPIIARKNQTNLGTIVAFSSGPSLKEKETKKKKKQLDRSSRSKNFIDDDEDVEKCLAVQGQYNDLLQIVVINNILFHFPPPPEINAMIMLKIVIPCIRWCHKVKVNRDLNFVWFVCLFVVCLLHM